MTDAERAQWEAERRQGIGGSDIAVALGEKPYGCSRRFVYDKRGVEPDYRPSEKERLLFRRGEVLEDHAARRYAERVGCKVIRRAAAVHPDFPWARVNVDREIIGHPRRDSVGILEVKTRGGQLFRQQQYEGLTPSDILQLQWGMFVRNRTWGAFAILCPDTFECETWEVDYDATLVDAVRPSLQAMWELVGTDGELPERLEATDSRCRRCWWRRTCQGAAPPPPAEELEGVTLERDDSLTTLLEDRQVAIADLDEHKALVAAIEAEIKTTLGARQAVESGTFRVYYRQTKPRTTVDARLLESKFPDVYAKVTKQSAGARMFRVYEV